jgi:hypothetical protein
LDLFDCVGVTTDRAAAMGVTTDRAAAMGVTTDRAAAMTCRYSGLVQRARNVAPYSVSYNCSIHRETLAAKELDKALHEVLTDAAKMLTLSQPVRSTHVCSKFYVWIWFLNMYTCYFTQKFVGCQEAVCCKDCFSRDKKCVHFF